VGFYKVTNFDKYFAMQMFFYHYYYSKICLLNIVILYIHKIYYIILLIIYTLLHGAIARMNNVILNISSEININNKNCVEIVLDT